MRARPSGSRSSSAATRRLVLVGGGLAHVEVLRRLARRRLPGVEVTLVSPAPTHPYTGMLTGYVAGEYVLDELLFSLDGLARRADAAFVKGSARCVRADQRIVDLDDGCRLGYDVLSLDVGSTVTGADDLPIHDAVFPVRPLENVLRLAEALDARREPTRLVVVGGGASGVELALTCQARLAARGSLGSVVVLEAGARILPQAGAGVARLAWRVLAARGIEVRTGARATSVHDRIVRTEAGGEHAFDVLVWASGPAAPPLVRGSGLPHDASGWLRVDRSLRTLERPDVLGAGDAVSIQGAAWMARTGVYAVREAPALWRTLTSVLAGEPPPEFRPRRRFLWILNAGDGTAVLSWGELHGHSRWARALKHRIDSRFMRRYRAV